MREIDFSYVLCEIPYKLFLRVYKKRSNKFEKFFSFDDYEFIIIIIYFVTFTKK